MAREGDVEAFPLPLVRGLSPYSPSQNKQKTCKTQAIFGQFGDFLLFSGAATASSLYELGSRLHFCCCYNLFCGKLNLILGYCIEISHSLWKI